MFKFDKNKKYKKETESKVVIRFQDCDPLQHLNNAKYFDYFFNAREDQVPILYGLEPADFYRQFKSAWVVYTHQISYLRPAMMGEWVKIMSRVVWFNENTVVIEYYMTDAAKKQLKTVLWTTLRYIDVKQAMSQDHHPQVMDYLSAIKYVGVEIDELNFKKRVKEVKDSLK